MKRADHQWRTMYELWKLIATEANNESSYQKLFSDHPHILNCIGIDEIIPFDKTSSYRLPFDDERGYTPEPDFLGIDRSSNRLFIVELKTPFVGKITTSRSDGNRAKFSADADSYISQAIEYRDSIIENKEARGIVAKAFGVDVLKSFKPILIYAMERDNDWALVSRLADERKSIDIHAFDLLLYKLLKQYSRDREFLLERKTGFTMVVHFVSEMTSDKEEVLISVGHKESGCMQLILHNDKLIGRAFNADFSIEVSASFLTNNPTFAAFEFSTGNDGHHSLLLVDERLASCNFSERECTIDVDN
ncbi:DUF4263 domain-containing protein [bacterium]|nr:DUF4263 domain-containing protein [bacterium]